MTFAYECRRCHQLGFVRIPRSNLLSPDDRFGLYRLPRRRFLCPGCLRYAAIKHGRGRRTKVAASSLLWYRPLSWDGSDFSLD